MNTPLILYHIPNAAKAQQVLALCKDLRFRAKPLTASDAGRTVGTLAGLPGAAANTQKAPAGYKLPELLILSGLEGAALEFFLAAWKKAGIAPVPLKAILTPHNANWQLYALAEELQREHAAMLLYRQNPPKT